MGQVWTCVESNEVFKSQYSYQKIERGLLEDTKVSKTNHFNNNDSSEIFKHEQVQNHLLSSPYIKHAAIINFADGRILTADFECDREGIRDIVRAFKARPQFIRDDGIRLGPSFPIFKLSVFEKDNYFDGLLENEIQRKAISYGTASVSCGCTVQRTLGSIIIVTYEGNPDLAKSVVKQISAELIEQGL